MATIKVTASQLRDILDNLPNPEKYYRKRYNFAVMDLEQLFVKPIGKNTPVDLTPLTYRTLSFISDGQEWITEICL